ncbi:Aste57867_21950 [Aphanomyces stellatus]|uniref:Aste57867_21950 protein n=1 Tax=Aphanomyces stellatus TaxID=120398 RepID=A0A485LIY3_9STRA|nr:hypothetical protein As57867_021881 [Aphanomyces stellatus]VFT98618.1 Aste57867_21950 [Aphanomyces stellatus]
MDDTTLIVELNASNIQDIYLHVISVRDPQPALTASVEALVLHVSIVLILVMQLAWLLRHFAPKVTSVISPSRLSSTYIPRHERVEPHVVSPSSVLSPYVAASVVFAIVAALYVSITKDLPYSAAAASLSYWSMSLTTVSIVMQAMELESSALPPVLSVVGACVVFPVVVASIWLDNTCFNPRDPHALFGVGVIDFGGSGVLHLVAGTILLVVALLSPTSLSWTPSGRWSSTVDTTTAVLLWVGTHAILLNRVALDVASSHQASVAVACVVNVTLAVAGSAVVGMFVDSTPSPASTSVAAAIVGVSAIGPLAPPLAAGLIGASSAILFHGVMRLQWMDTLPAAMGHGLAIHFVCAVWGLLLAAVAGSAHGHSLVYGVAAPHVGLQCAAQLVFLLFVVLWTTFVTSVVLSCHRCCFNAATDATNLVVSTPFDTIYLPLETDYMRLLDDYGMTKPCGGPPPSTAAMYPAPRPSGHGVVPPPVSKSSAWHSMSLTLDEIQLMRAETNSPRSISSSSENGQWT